MKPSIFWGVVAILGVLAAAVFLWRIPAPTGEGAANGLDYWLGRYQTLLAGVLAILGAWAAIHAVRLQIAYLQDTEQRASEEQQRVSLATVGRMVDYASNVILSKHHVASASLDFPYDVYPAILLDVGPLERAFEAHLMAVPPGVSMRCLYLIYAMKLMGDMIEPLREQANKGKQSFEEAFATKLPVLTHLEALLACCDLIKLQLVGVAAVPRAQWSDAGFDQIPEADALEMFARREVPPARARQYLTELGMQLVKTRTDPGAASPPGVRP